MAEALTPRQTEVFIAVLSLSSRKEAARELGISIHTVRGHLAHIRTRLDVDDCMQAAYVMGHDGLAVPALIRSHRGICSGASTADTDDVTVIGDAKGIARRLSLRGGQP